MSIKCKFGYHDWYTVDAAWGRRRIEMTDEERIRFPELYGDGYHDVDWDDTYKDEICRVCEKLSLTIDKNRKRILMEHESRRKRNIALSSKVKAMKKIQDRMDELA